MTYSTQTLLATANQAINHALSSSEIQAKLAEFGFDRTQLLKGQALYAEAWTQHLAQQRAYRVQVAATDAFHVAWKQAKTLFRVHYMAAKGALANERDATQLFTLTRATSWVRWRKRAHDFYEAMHTHPEYRVQLAVLNVTEIDLQKGEQLLQLAEMAKAEQEVQRTAARAATRSAHTKLAQLRKWLVIFSQMAHRIFAEEPEVLLQLGLLQRVQGTYSTGYPGEDSGLDDNSPEETIAMGMGPILVQEDAEGSSATETTAKDLLIVYARAADVPKSGSMAESN